jgi:hypothetical protein
VGTHKFTMPRGPKGWRKEAESAIEDTAVTTVTAEVRGLLKDVQAKGIVTKV